MDQAGNHKSLFWKHDYINQWLLPWICPPQCGTKQRNRTKMRLHNELNGSTIEGESTTKNAARGDRRTAVLLDEFAAVEDGAAMRSATTDVTPCRLVNSTPKVGTEYSRWMLSGQIRTISLPWYEHPEKGLGRYEDYEETKKKWRIVSPWYLNEEKRRSPQEMAEEVDMDHFGAGQIFFEPNVIEQHKILFCRKPNFIADIKFIKGVANDSVAGIIRGRLINKIKIAPGPTGP